ncbi:hypothetical protein [Amycolatopsis sp. lyj-23]|uniref:hypothetical protein n=1 Tax=Amycolatopsis sp. lyj-23 TaxID=2789283 RepID=UPI00397A8C52
MSIPEPQELLEMRLVALAQDVAKVRRVANAASTRHQSHDKLNRLIGASTGDSVINHLTAARRAVLNLRRDADDGTDLDQALGGLEDLLRVTFETAKKAKAELATIDETVVEIDTQLTASLHLRCAELASDISALQDRLKGDEDPCEIWKAYESTFENGCQDLFADYVDLLGGLTLRDNALDDEVCAITDALLRYIPSSGKLLTLPARRPTLQSALNELVKVGFPDWTIWNIPLVGLEIGKAHAVKPMSEFFLEHRGTAVPGLPDDQPDAYRALLAEGYAAYVIGPAYGCAAALLKFQPQRPFDLERAAVILCVLEELGGTAAKYQHVVRLTREYWQEAVTHLGDPSLSQPKLDSMRPYARSICDELHTEDIDPFDAANWGEVEEYQALLEREPAEIGRSSADLNPLVLVNAAWAAWLANPGSPEWAETVNGNVKAMWKAQPGRRPQRGGRRGQA